MFVIKYQKLFLSLSTAFVVLALLAVAVFGLKPGVDFSGGSLLEILYTEKAPSPESVETVLEEVAVTGVSIRREGEKGYAIRTAFLEEEAHAALAEALSFEGRYPFEEARFSSVGPSVGRELRYKAYWALAAVIVMIIFYVAFAFRKVSKPVSSWKYGFVAILALIHDIIIPTGVFAILGQTLGFEVDALFVTALLAILGFSVNDTIVVFDRIRENLSENEQKGAKEPFADVVGKSLSQTLVRSVNTSLTVFIALLFLLFLAGTSVETFVVTMLVGVVAGSYSSIFLASPLLVVLARKK